MKYLYINLRRFTLRRILLDKGQLDVDDESSLMIVVDDVDKMMATKMMVVVMMIRMILVVGSWSTWSSSW